MHWMALLALLYCPLARCQSSHRDAVRNLERAVMRIPLVRQSVKATERHVLSKLNIDKKQLKYLLPLMLLNAKTIDTGKVVPVKVELFQGELRPVVRYNVQSGDMNTMVIYNLNF